MDLMWFLMFAHLVGDYALQSDRMASEKGQSYRLLTAHVAIYTVAIGASLWGFALVTQQIEFWSLPIAGLLAPLFVIHWCQDLIKGRWFNSNRQAYYVDQVLHVAQLLVIRLLAV